MTILATDTSVLLVKEIYNTNISNVVCQKVGIKWDCLEYIPNPIVGRKYEQVRNLVKDGDSSSWEIVSTRLID